MKGTIYYGNTNYGKNKSVILVVMNGMGKYKVSLNGSVAETNEREKGMFEITIPSEIEKADISVQLV